MHTAVWWVSFLLHLLVLWRNSWLWQSMLYYVLFLGFGDLLTGCYFIIQMGWLLCFAFIISQQRSALLHCPFRAYDWWLSFSVHTGCFVLLSLQFLFFPVFMSLCVQSLNTTATCSMIVKVLAFLLYFASKVSGFYTFWHVCLMGFCLFSFPFACSHFLLPRMWVPTCADCFWITPLCTLLSLMIL